jgi:uncharacterized protein (UPF0248 family)
MSTKYPRDVLRKEWFTKGELSELTITITDRLMPNEEVEIQGGQILNLGKSFFLMVGKREYQADVSIPYHRIKKITRGGETIWMGEKCRY